MEFLKVHYRNFETSRPRTAKALRYLISGGLATLVNLISIYLFTDVFGIWYLASAIAAFIVGFFVSFFLQKYWTFREMSVATAHAQMVKFLVVSLINLGLNTLLMFIAVDIAHIHYLLAQFLVSGIIAAMSFFVYKRFVFKVAA